MNITVNPSYQSLENFIRTLPEVFQHQGVMLHDKRNVVKLYEIEGLKLVVKRYKVPLFFQRIDYTFFRPSKAKRAYLFALRLKELGISTPEPIAYVECKRFGIFRQGYFVSTYTSDSDIKSNIGLLDTDSQLFDGLVDYLVFLHSKGFLHGDTNLSNFLFHKKSDGRYEFAVIDLNRSHFRESPTKEECLSNLMRLTRDRGLSSRIVSAYAERRGWDAAESVEYVSRQIDKYERKRKARKFYKQYVKRKNLKKNG